MKKTLKYDVHLITPTGKEVAPMQIVYDDSEDVYNPASEITLLYNGIEYKGSGVDYLWVDTIADLQVKLPENVKLACCMTCCHGNMCPYGTGENELFCTKDVRINSKDDMIDLFDKSNPFDERAVASFYFCEDFIYQSDDYYTYNDYLYQLEKRIKKCSASSNNQTNL